MAKAPEGKLEIVSQREVGVREASAVAALGDDTFLVACDEDGIYRCRPGTAPVLLAAMSDAEGLCVRSDRLAVYALGEKEGDVWLHALSNGELTPGERLGALPRIGDDRQGWEGIAHVPRGVFGDAEMLIAVHQERPRRVGLFDAHTLEEHAILRLPKAAKKALGDLNDVAVDPETHHIFVLSGKEGCIAELQLVERELELVRVYGIATTKRDVPEGITFDAERRVWIVSDGEGILREVRLAP